MNRTGKVYADLYENRYHPGEYLFEGQSGGKATIQRPATAHTP
ncbi:hypothetical protein ES705_36923 [subsurface metagenome]